MAEYAIVFARSARRKLEAFQEPLLARILNRIESLAVTPRPPGCRNMVSGDSVAPYYSGRQTIKTEPAQLGRHTLWNSLSFKGFFDFASLRFSVIQRNRKVLNAP